MDSDSDSFIFLVSLSYSFTILQFLNLAVSYSYSYIFLQFHINIVSYQEVLLQTVIANRTLKARIVYGVHHRTGRMVCTKLEGLY